MALKADTWSSGDPYEYFMGRWSRMMAPVFLEWLNASENLVWLDLGCGTGALSEAIERIQSPVKLYGVDPSPDFLETCKKHLSSHAEFLIGSSDKIPFGDEEIDVLVTGLALNFFPNLSESFAEMKRVVKHDGIIAAYVWDYAGRMDFLRKFWDAAREVDPQATQLDESVRFPLYKIENLKNEFIRAGLTGVETTFLDIETTFSNFDDYWNPFLGGQGPAPTYLLSLPEEKQEQIKSLLLKQLPVENDGSINMLGRAVAVRGSVPQ